MGNVSEKTNSFTFIESLEQSFITQTMLEGMIMRWCEQGKPLFMASKEFKDRLL